MLPTPTESQIEEVVSLIGNNLLDGKNLESGVQTVVGDTVMIQRLTAWLPEIFGIKLIKNNENLSKVNLPNNFSVQNKNGNGQALNLTWNPFIKWHQK